MKKIVIVLFFVLGLSFIGHYEKAEAFFRTTHYNQMDDFQYYAPSSRFPTEYISHQKTPTVPTPIVEPGYPACNNPVPGMSYITLNIYCSCPDGTIHGSNGGYNSCATDVSVNPTVPTPYVTYPTAKTQSIYDDTSNSNCWNDCSNYDSFQNNYRSNSWQSNWNWY